MKIFSVGKIGRLGVGPIEGLASRLLVSWRKYNLVSALNKCILCKVEGFGGESLKSLSCNKLVLFFLVYLVTLTTSSCLEASSQILPSWELEIVNSVSAEYRLSDWQRQLLVAIRKSENGRPGREFGVLHPRAINTTYRNQAQWAAGSIKKRCPDEGSLSVFAARWAPIGAANDPDGLNGNWEKNVRWWLAKQEEVR